MEAIKILTKKDHFHLNSINVLLSASINNFCDNDIVIIRIRKILLRIFRKDGGKYKRIYTICSHKDKKQILEIIHLVAILCIRNLIHVCDCF